MSLFNDGAFTNFFSQKFSQFIVQNIDRTSFIQQTLNELEIQSNIIQIDNSKHIYVHFPSSAYNPAFKIKTVIAHYDRVENTPGANDNSAAVFQIIEWAKRLSLSPKKHNVRIFFTDGEELGESGVAEQGAFGIASKFRKLGIMNDEIYVFDCCGRGDVLVVSQMGQKNSGSTSFNQQLEKLFTQTYKLAAFAAPQSWIKASVPYSDNAAFIACGIPAVAITLLPKDEATKYVFNNITPLTWQLIHTPNDNLQSLDESSFSLMARVLDALALQKTAL